MNIENVPKAKKDRSSLILQMLAFVFGFLSTSFLFGSGLLFAVLASAVSCADYLSKHGKLSFLGSMLGGAAGYVFAAFGRESVVRLVFDAKHFGREFTLVFDLRLQALVLFLLMPLLSVVFCACVARRASRAVCVAASAGVVIAAALAQLVIFTVGRYSAFSVELLREKLNVLIDIFEAMLSAGTGVFSGYPVSYTAEQLGELALSIVYSLPSVFVLWCGALAFLHSFCVKRALRRSGALGFIYTDGWPFIPGIVTAAVYVLLFIVTSLMSLLSNEPDVAYFGLNVIFSLLSGAFLITGVTALRGFAEARKRAGMRLGALWIVVLVVGVLVYPSVAFSLVRLAGLLLVFMKEAARRRGGPPEPR